MTQIYYPIYLRPTLMAWLDSVGLKKKQKQKKNSCYQVSRCSCSIAIERSSCLTVRFQFVFRSGWRTSQIWISPFILPQTTASPKAEKLSFYNYLMKKWTPVQIGKSCAGKYRRYSKWRGSMDSQGRPCCFWSRIRCNLRWFCRHKLPILRPPLNWSTVPSGRFENLFIYQQKTIIITFLNYSYKCYIQVSLVALFTTFDQCAWSCHHTIGFGWNLVFCFRSGFGERRGDQSQWLGRCFRCLCTKIENSRDLTAALLMFRVVVIVTWPMWHGRKKMLSQLHVGLRTTWYQPDRSYARQRKEREFQPWYEDRLFPHSS